MHIYFSIAFTLLAAVAGMYLLAKAKTENLGKFFNIVSYLIVIVAGLSLLCQLTRGVCRMACRTGICPPSEHCMPGMMIHKEINMHGMSGGCAMNSGCGEEERCCESKGHCEGMSGCCEMKCSHGQGGECCKDGNEGKGGCMKDGEKECSHDMKKGCEMNMKKDSVKTK
jgi:ABC-type nickel/cobalt efflux system permease component RcnA